MHDKINWIFYLHSFCKEFLLTKRTILMNEIYCEKNNDLFLYNKYRNASCLLTFRTWHFHFFSAQWRKSPESFRPWLFKSDANLNSLNQGLFLIQRLEKLYKNATLQNVDVRISWSGINLVSLLISYRRYIICVNNFWR